MGAQHKVLLVLFLTVEIMPRNVPPLVQLLALQQGKANMGKQQRFKMFQPREEESSIQMIPPTEGQLNEQMIPIPSMAGLPSEQEVPKMGGQLSGQMIPPMAGQPSGQVIRPKGRQQNWKTGALIGWPQSWLIFPMVGVLNWYGIKPPMEYAKKLMNVPNNERTTELENGPIKRAERMNERRNI